MMQEFYFVSFFDLQSRKQGFHELDWKQATNRTQLIHDIAGMQFEMLDRVYRAEAGRFEDCTKEIAEAVLTLCVKEQSGVCHELRSFLHEHCGIDRVEECLADQREDA